MELIIFSLFILLVLPASFIIILWRSDFDSKLQWVLNLLATILIISWLTQAGNWSWVSYYIRFLWPVLLLPAVYFSWKEIKNLPFTITYTKGQKFSHVIYIVLILVFGFYNIATIKSYTVKEEAIDLTFPLDDGTYYIGQGGNNELMNYHQIAPPQKFALDILKINSFGVRAKGLYPKELANYYIYEDHLHSPCTGKIIAVENNLPDHIPPATDPENATGNYVKLTCDHHEASIYMAHMKKGSVVVSSGDQVETGQLLGEVGNSGNTTEPHLHIHAELDGEGIPITFDGRFLVRNSLVK